MQPVLKWAGGKRWLFNQAFGASLPAFSRYVEPFVGGGAGFFAMKPKAALLADANPELINVYRAIRSDPRAVQDAMVQHQTRHSRDYFYMVRDHEPVDDIDRAARTLYLNRTCWNGLYRLNMNGKFNVPIGTKSAVVLDTDDFLGAAALLEHADLRVCDFAKTLADCAVGDLVFYRSTLHSHAQHERLR